MPKTPYIGCIGENMIDTTEFTIIAERLSVTTVTDFRKAIIALTATYYTFNIQYPKEVGNTLLFIERHL